MCAMLHRSDSIKVRMGNAKKEMAGSHRQPGVFKLYKIKTRGRGVRKEEEQKRRTERFLPDSLLAYHLMTDVET